MLQFCDIMSLAQSGDKFVFPNSRVEFHHSKNLLFTTILQLKDERLFQCGSQEAGLVKYDKYTCKNEQ